MGMIICIYKKNCSPNWHCIE